MQKHCALLMFIFANLKREISTFLPKIKTWIDSHVQPVIALLETVKMVIASPAASIAEHIAGVPAALVEGITKGIDKAIQTLQITELVADAKTLEDKIRALAQWISSHPESIHNDIIRRIATIILSELQPEDHDLPDNKIDAIVQMVYTMNKAIQAEAAHNEAANAPAPTEPDKSTPETK